MDGNRFSPDSPPHVGMFLMRLIGGRSDIMVICPLATSNSTIIRTRVSGYADPSPGKYITHGYGADSASSLHSRMVFR